MIHHIYCTQRYFALTALHPCAQEYDITSERVVQSSMDGINGTIFAYGVTSSGKTHTMMESIKTLLNDGKTTMPPSKHATETLETSALPLT